MTKLHITTETEEGHILKSLSFQIEEHHYPSGLMPEDIQKIIDESLVDEKNYDEKMKEIIDDANRITQHND